MYAIFCHVSFFACHFSPSTIRKSLSLFSHQMTEYIQKSHYFHAKCTLHVKILVLECILNFKQTILKWISSMSQANVFSIFAINFLHFIENKKQIIFWWMNEMNNNRKCVININVVSLFTRRLPSSIWKNVNMHNQIDR